MEISPAMALIPKEGKVQNAPRIQVVALCCIWLSNPSRYDNSAFL